HLATEQSSQPDEQERGADIPHQDHHGGVHGMKQQHERLIDFSPRSNLEKSFLRSFSLFEPVNGQVSKRKT
ncbi:hypothetical protein NY486_06960, partial [Enterobacter hormaechei]|nr:hypothetical protein [Enterobacter hormaechei]